MIIVNSGKINHCCLFSFTDFCVDQQSRESIHIMININLDNDNISQVYKSLYTSSFHTFSLSVHSSNTVGLSVINAGNFQFA